MAYSVADKPAHRSRPRTAQDAGDQVQADLLSTEGQSGVDTTGVPCCTCSVCGQANQR